MKSETEPLHCFIHPGRETMLRCNKCGQPICSSCAVHTPTGYRCNSCIKSQQKIFNTANTADYVLAAVIAAAIAFGGSYFVRYLGFFTLFLAPAASLAIAKAVRFAVQGRRSRTLAHTTFIAAIVGSLPYAVLYLITFLRFSASIHIGILWPLIWQAAYTILMGSALYYRTRSFVIG